MVKKTVANRNNSLPVLPDKEGNNLDTTKQCYFNSNLQKRNENTAAGK
jgi:hypothetical protein